MLSGLVGGEIDWFKVLRSSISIIESSMVIELSDMVIGLDGAMMVMGDVGVGVIAKFGSVDSLFGVC